MKLSLFYPVKPYWLNQVFGNNPPDPQYPGHGFYERFKMMGHNGADLMASHGQPVYAPCDGLAWYSVDKYKGDGIDIVPDGTFDYKGGQSQFRVVLWHLCPANDPQFPIQIPIDRAVRVYTGQLLGYADNTGAPFESTGDHLHLGLHPGSFDGFRWTDLEYNNGYNGCIDPAPYCNGYFAVDATLVIKIMTGIKDLMSKVVSLLQK